MTEAEIEAAIALNVRVAAEVMGWTRRAPHIWADADGECNCTDAAGVGPADLVAAGLRGYIDLRDFDPAREITDAWRVVEHMQAQGWITQLDNADGTWACKLSRPGRLLAFESVFNQATAPLAICQAALLVAARGTP